ncbi:MAG: hypothetical protein EBQ80_01800 [Proteobacteria bacterium]|nr:hypothetical protein [Pseudomonadota bacterium]
MGLFPQKTAFAAVLALLLAGCAVRVDKTGITFAPALQTNQPLVQTISNRCWQNADAKVELRVTITEHTTESHVAGHYLPCR